LGDGPIHSPQAFALIVQPVELGRSGSPKGPAAAHFWIGQDREADPGVYGLQTVVVMEDVDYRRVHLQYQ
jgi:hypothetical protein